ncbi:MAG: DEAD/DEAH box helicase [Candidatus Moraniibacteriota bacterium]|nr:MAG: DEAD/DEAH box helicase [Candidatus Moranbacteria bacterium]
MDLCNHNTAAYQPRLTIYDKDYKPCSSEVKKAAIKESVVSQSSEALCQGHATLIAKNATLRPKQVELVNAVRQAFKSGAQRPCVMAATGFGKSVVAGYIIRSALDKGAKRVVLIVDSLTLINQLLDTFRGMFNLECGVIQGFNEQFDLTRPVQIATPQTLDRRFKDERLGGVYRDYKPDLVIVDECHIQYQGTRDAIEYWGCKVVGFTATPYAKGMGKTYDALVKASPMDKLIAEGDLANYRAYSHASPDFSGYKVSANGDIQGAENAYDDGLIGDVYETWATHASDRLTIGFAPTIGKCEAFAELFRAKGVRSLAIHSKLSDAEAERLIQQFKEREIQVLWSVAKLVKGFDVPEASCLIDCQPTFSLMRHIQKGGRVLRPHPLKQYAIILDHAGNMRRNGLFEDASIEELSTGKKGEKNADRQEPKNEPIECPSCKVEIRKTDYICPHCGHERQKVSQRPDADEIGWAEGELVEFKSIGQCLKSIKTMEAKARLLAAIKYEASEIERKKIMKGEVWLKRDGWVATQYRNIIGVWPDSSLKNVLPAYDSVISRYLTSKRIAFVKSNKFNS